ncbi:MAG TPA: fumarylacetoacetate hydrolase family protein [Chitinophagales bacterium]|nr:fumarylacetoacetate hydrolase family protein [Chitinophagales bacterium]HRH54230.1 fumarylacetoacetate hydrolase family protein [Chitinophagales bacterium]
MKIFCVGRNYSEHAKELNNEIPEAPVIFMKPPTAILKGKDFYIPEFSSDMHYECELVFRVCKNGKHIEPQFAGKYIDAVTVGIDFTARDVQANQKKKGLPWEIAKAFDNSAVVGEFLPISELPDNQSVKFNMQKNGADVQIGNSADMIYPITELVAYLSKFFTLQQGDLIFTGTPAGVGPVAIGDVLTGFLEGTKRFEINIK